MTINKILCSYEEEEIHEKKKYEALSRITLKTFFSINQDYFLSVYRFN